MNNRAALNQYKSVGVQSSMQDASPHEMIALLLEGAQDRIAAAKGAVERDDKALKGEKIGGAIAIVDSLRASLDHQQGGDIARNLYDLYDFVEGRLLEANADNDAAKLNEAANVLKEIRAGWEGIPAQLRVS